MMLKFVVRSASLLFVLGAGIAASGCNVTVTSTDTCHADDSVYCSDGSSGYTCTGAAVPDGNCGDALCTDGDSCAFCCNTTTIVIAATCKSDPSVLGCEAGSYGYSCTGTDTPDSNDPSLFCSSGTPTGSETQYCCLYGALSNCTSDPSVTASCNGQGADYGFSCTGSATPDTTFANLNCSSATVVGANSEYCCNLTNSTTTATCTIDTSLGCFGGSTGYTCSGGATPTVTNCSTAEQGPTGDTYYCCGGSAGACAADSTVTGCATGSTGYSCTGSANPGTSGLWCSEGVPGTGSATWYCCADNASTTTSCVQDQSVACTTAGSYGFACSSTDTPAQANPALTCSAGTAGNDGNTLYCCQ